MLRLLHTAVLVLVSVIVLSLGTSDARADRRIALVIGNSKYHDPSLVLPNPGTDASDLAVALRALQFEVVLIQDASVNQMDGALQRFAEAASTADTVLFYYAGHALQYQGQNFLMPVDASSDVMTATALNRSMVTDLQVRDALDRSTGVKVLILDACRNNPYADRFKRAAYGTTRAVENTRGLARIDKTQGSVIAYAAAPGDVASDGDGRSRNSPYTASLLYWLKQPAVEISTMFRRVTSDVYDLTKGKQQPEYTSTLRNDYFLDPIADQRIWERLRDTADPSALRDFIKQFPNSVHALQAQNRLNLLADGQRQRKEDEEKERVARENEQRQQAICRREGDEFITLRDDLAGLQAKMWACSKVVADTTARIKEIMAQRETAAVAAKAEAEARAKEQERLVAEGCRLDRERVEVLGGDLEKLQDIARQALCPPAKNLANDKIKTVTALRQEAERRRVEAERVCNSEQRQLTVIWDDVAKLQAFKGNCDQIVAMATERAKRVVEDRERVELATRAEGQRVCASEQAELAATGNDLGKLKELQARVKCNEVKPGLNDRIRQVDATLKAEQNRQQQAALKLAALEEEQNEVRRREEARARTEAERIKSEERCKAEDEQLNTIANDLLRLKDFAKQIGCQTVASIARGRIDTLEKEEKVCKQEDAKLASIISRSKGISDKRLVEPRKQVASLEQDLNCARLRPAVAQEHAIIRIKLAQVGLRQAGCYKGDVDGILSDATREAVQLFLTKISRPDGTSEVDDDLLNRLGDRANERACKPEPEKAPEPVATHTRPPREEAPPPRRPVVSAPPVHRSEPAPRREVHSAPPPPRPQAAPAPRPAAVSSAPAGGGIVGLH